MTLLLVATVQSHIAQFHKPLMRLLKENGWEIHVAARNNLAEKNGLSMEYPDRVFDVPFLRSPFDPRNFKAYRMLRKILAENHYDVVHCNTPVGGVLTRLAAGKYRKRGTKVFYTAHGFHFYQGAPKKNWLLYYPIEHLLSRRTDKLITIAAEDYAFAESHFSCAVERIHGVGADDRRFCPLSATEQARCREQLGLTGQAILCVGELLPNKNQKTAILAMRELCKTHPNAQLLIAGNGPERKNLEQLIETENLGACVRFLDYDPHIERYMQVCDLLVACSHREGLPMNIVEAMLCGKPVVASKNRGHCELVQDGVSGYLVDADDYEQIAERMRTVLAQPGAFTEAAIAAAKPYAASSVRAELAAIYAVKEGGDTWN